MAGALAMAAGGGSVVMRSIHSRIRTRHSFRLYLEERIDRVGKFASDIAKLERTMNRHVPRALSRAAFIIAVIFVGYFILSALSLGIQTRSWILLSAVVVLILAFGLPFLDKAFGDKLSLLRTWPTSTINARIRRVLGLRFGFLGGNTSFNNPQTGKQVVVSIIWVFSLFLILLAIAGVRLLFGRTVSDTLANLLGTAFMVSLSMAAFQFMSLRLSTKYDFRSAVLAIAIYVPIVMLAISTSIVWDAIIDDDPFRIRRGFFLIFVCGFGVILTVVTPLLRGLRKPAVPAPAFTATPQFQRAEIAVSVASLAAVAIIFFISS